MENLHNTSESEEKVAHKSSGLYKLLSNAIIYRGIQKIFGADNLSRVLVSEYIRPFSSARVVDLGCGIGHYLDLMPPTVEYVGIDFNQKYIEQAKRTFGSRGVFCCSSLEEYFSKNNSTFDIAICIGVLHHLSNNEALKLIEYVFQNLNTGGIFVTCDGTWIEQQPLLAKFLIGLDRGKAIRQPDGYRELATKYFSKIELNVRHDFLNLPYTHAVMRCEK